jgi:hypothetical protein
MLFMFVIVCGHFEWERICAGFNCGAFVDPIIMRTGLDPINQFTPTPVHMVAPVPNHNCDFYRHTS